MQQPREGGRPHTSQPGRPEPTAAPGGCSRPVPPLRATQAPHAPTLRPLGRDLGQCPAADAPLPAEAHAWTARGPAQTQGSATGSPGKARSCVGRPRANKAAGAYLRDRRAASSSAWEPTRPSRDQGAGPPWLTSQAARLLLQPISAPCQAAIKLQCAHTQCWLRWYTRAARGVAQAQRQPSQPRGSRPERAPCPPHARRGRARLFHTHDPSRPRAAAPHRAPPGCCSARLMLCARGALACSRAGWLSGAYPACCMLQSARHPASIYCVVLPLPGKPGVAGIYRAWVVCGCATQRIHHLRLSPHGAAAG